MKRAPKPIACWVTESVALSACPGQTREAALIARIQQAAAAGIDWIQLREKDLETPKLLELARQATKESCGTSARILVNDRFDIAWTARAGGVHLGENSLPAASVVRVARNVLGKNFLIGASCHSIEAVAQAAHEGADYVFFGPVFSTPSKVPYGEPQGLRRLQSACGATSIPVLAIGGITGENARSCLDAGAAGIAAIRLFQQASDLSSLLAALR